MPNNIKYNWLDKYHDGGEIGHSHEGSKGTAHEEKPKEEPGLLDKFASSVSSLFTEEEAPVETPAPTPAEAPIELPPQPAEDFFAFESSAKSVIPPTNEGFKIVTEEDPVFGERVYREYDSPDVRSLEDAKAAAANITPEVYKENLGAYGDRTKANWSYYKDDLFTPITQKSRSAHSVEETYTPYEVVTDMASKLGLDPAMLYTNLQTEGMDLFIDDHRKHGGTHGPLGFAHLGTDTFGEADTLAKAKKELPGTFVEGETYFLRGATNEKSERVKTANFSNLKTGIGAAAIMLKESDERVAKLAEKYNMSPEAKEFFTYVDYNAGRGNAQKMAASWSKKGYLEDDRWKDARPDESWKAPYNFAIKRFSNKRAMDPVFRGKERIEANFGEAPMETRAIGQLPTTPLELPVPQEIETGPSPLPPSKPTRKGPLGLIKKNSGGWLDKY